MALTVVPATDPAVDPLLETRLSVVGNSSWQRSSDHDSPLREATIDELRFLQREVGYPLVTVLLGTAPDLLVGADHLVRLETLCETARKRLLLEIEPAEANAFVDALRGLGKRIVGQRTVEGIAFFASERVSRAYRVLSRIEDRVVVDPTFATRDLARSIALNPPYRLLVLTQDSARLLVGSGEQLREVKNDVFPIATGTSVVDREKRTFADRDKRALHDTAAFLRRVVVDLRCDPATAGLPLIAVASTAMTGAIRSCVDLAPIGVVVGSHEKTAVSRLSKLARPVIDAYLADIREAALERLEHAVGARQGAVGINHVWSAAQRGLIDTLLVDESFRYPAWTTLGGKNLVRAFTPESPDVIDDAVDEVIEMVQRRDATVCFVRPGELGPDKIAAVLTRRRAS